MNDATKQAVQKLGTKFQWQESMAPVIHTIGMLKVFVFFKLTWLLCWNVTVSRRASLLGLDVQPIVGQH